MVKGCEATKANIPHVAQKQIQILDGQGIQKYMGRGRRKERDLFHGICTTKVLVKQNEDLRICKAAIFWILLCTSMGMYGEGKKGI